MAEHIVREACVALSRPGVGQGASMSASSGVFDESQSDESESRPTINLLEQWEEGAHIPKLVNSLSHLLYLSHGCMPLMPCL